MNKDIELCVGALNAVALFRSTFASGAESAELIRRTADALALNRSAAGAYGGLCQQVASAIYRGILNTEPSTT